MRIPRSRGLAAVVSRLALLAVVAASCSAANHVNSAPTTSTRASTPASTSASSPTSTSATTSASTRHKLLVVILENHSGTEAMQSMPNLRSWAYRFGQATDYRAVTHPSLPNYLAIWGGTTFGVNSDCAVAAAGCRPAAPTVFSQTISAGRTARAYQESMSQPCQTASAGRYAARHGPWPYWLATRERQLCRAEDVPAGTITGGALSHDITTGNLPVTGELTPDLCNDGHDCPLSTADRWLGRWVSALRAGPDWRNGRLTIVITFDEDDYSAANRVAFVVLDPRLSHVVVRRACNHYCLTRWLDENAGVQLLRNAASAPDLRAAFHL